MTNKEPLDRYVVEALTQAAATVPDDVTTRLMRALEVDSERAMTPAATSDRPTWSARPRALWLLVAAVVLIAVAPAFLSSSRSAPTPTTAVPTSSSVPTDRVVVTGESLSGAEVSTTDYLGAPLLITVWGSWCQPCLAAASTSADLANGHDLQVLGIAARGLSRAGDLAADNNLNLPYSSIYDPQGQISDQLLDQVLGSVPGYPISVLIDAEGRVVESWVGPKSSEVILEAVRALA